MTIAELRVGVLTATGARSRGQRLRTLEAATQEHEPLPVDDAVAEAFARLVAEVQASGRNPRVIDTLIAATALAHDAAVATQDDDFGLLPGVEVIRV